MSNDTPPPFETTPASQGVEAWPVAWMRGVSSPSTPYGPAEYDVDFVYGDDQPDGTGWVPLYRELPTSPDAPARGVEELIERLRAPIDWGHFVNDDHIWHYAALMGEAAEALAATRPQETGAQWRPIETAPKDGTKVDLWVEPHREAWKRSQSGAFAAGHAGRIADAWFKFGAWFRYVGFGTGERPYVSDCGLPTHWMPLPPAPAANTGSAR